MTKLANGDKAEYFTCECLSAEHTLRFLLQDDNGGEYPPELYAEILLPRHPFLKRCWRAAKYVAGKEEGWFALFIMRREEASRLQELLLAFEELHLAYHKEKEKKS
jgi:hypothetical protein